MDMSASERLSDEVLGQIVGAIIAAQATQKTHDCKFDMDDRDNIHELCRMLRNGGLEAIRDMITMSKQISASKKIIWFVALTASAGGTVTLVVLGVKAWLREAMGLGR